MAAEAVVVAAVPAPAGDLGALVAGWLLGFRSTNTRDAYRRDIAGWLIFCAANSLDPLTARRPHANAWACTLDAAGLKPSTIARRLSAVASWYAWLAAEEVITYSPMAHVRRPKVSDESATLGPDRDEARRLLDTASRLGRVPAALVSLLLLNGCRVSEVVGANIEDLDTEQGHRVLHVTRKGGRAALIPLAPRTAAALDALIGARTAGPIFQGRGRERLGRTGANYILNRVANAAGIDKHLSPHSLRHGFVTLSLEVGATLTDVQDAAGHADPRDAMTGPGIGWTMHRPTPSPTRSGALLSQAHGRMWGRRDSPAVGESLAGDEAERGRHHERKPSRTCGTRRRSENHPRGSGAPSPRKRKGHAMKGTTRKRGATWSYQFTVTRAGRRHHVTKGGFRTQKLAQDALTDAMAERRSGAHVEPTRLTLADYLRRQWLPVVQISRKPGTLRSYRDIMENRVIPALGDIRLSEVSAGDVAGLYAQLRISGKRTGGGGGLSERSIKAIQTALMAALSHAVEGGLIAVNPVRQLPKDARPTPRRTEIRTWTGEDLRAFLAASADDRYHTAYTLAAVTGMRRGELCGLRWSDVDSEHCRIAVRRARSVVSYAVEEGTPKTGKARTLSIDPATVALLKRHRKAQLRERMAWAGAGEDSGYVFTSEDGSPVHPKGLSERFERAVKRSDLPRITFHALRHTSATLLLERGVHPKTVAARLGHATVQTTLDTYSHVTPAVEESAADKLGAVVYGEQ